MLDLAQRTSLPVGGLEGLAASGALESLGVGRREGLWAAGALAGMGPGHLPLAEGADPPPLKAMGDAESSRADLWSTGVSVRHPVEFVREWLGEEGCILHTAHDHVLSPGFKVKVVDTEGAGDAFTAGLLVKFN